MPRVSVIVPIYGVERYIERCAVSLFEQTLESIEYIFVNDCTPDRSVEILKSVMDRYPDRKSQSRIINLHENCGQARARKIGISQATGDYVIQCDSDDWVEHQMYELLYQRAEITDADIVRCRFDRVSDGISTPCANISNEDHSSQKKLLEKLIVNTDLSSTCDKLVRRELYQSRDFIFPDDNMCEDYVMVAELFCMAKKVEFVDDIMYHYSQDNKSSISHIESTEHICQKALQITNNIKLIEYVLKKYHPEWDFETQMVAMKLMAKNTFRTVIHKKGMYSLWRTWLREINNRVLTNRYIPVKEKLAFILCYLRLYPVMMKIKHRLC